MGLHRGAPAAPSGPLISRPSSAWDAAVGSFIRQDFEAFDGSQTEAAGADVEDFTVQQVGTDFGGVFFEISTSVSTQQTGGSLVPGSVAVGGATNSNGTAVLFSYDSPITAWAADLGGFSNEGRQTAISISGVNYNIAFGQGFFGKIDNHHSFDAVQVVYVRGAADGFGLDNVSYSSPASVPGPLPALGAAAAFGYSRKLRKRIARSKAVPVASAIE